MVDDKRHGAGFGRPRLLVLGCGDVGMRLLPALTRRFRVFALTSRAQRCAELRAAGAIPIVADLDCAPALARLGRLASRIVHLAPPQSEGAIDRRTRNLCAILPERSQLVYISTSGVYGDCGGAFLDETRPVHPQSARAQRRVDAERVLRAWARRRAACLSILRVPGIYAGERLPLQRLRQQVPVLERGDDVYSNHIHADDLARLIMLALFRGRPNRVYHAVDDSELRMGEYFDLVAAAHDLPPPPRLPRERLRQELSPLQYSFMRESRRLSNARMKAELGMRLCYPRVADGLVRRGE